MRIIQDGLIAHIEKSNSIVGSEDVLPVLSGKPLVFFLFAAE